MDWEDPPDTGTKYDWVALAKEAVTNPMVWGKVFDSDRTSVVNAIRQGNVSPVHPDLGFEVKTANNTREPRRKCSLFLRYNPSTDLKKIRRQIFRCDAPTLKGNLCQNPVRVMGDHCYRHQSEEE